MHENEAAKSPWKRRFIILFIITVVLPVLTGVWLWQRFGGDVPVEYASPTEHFKYGSTGGEHEMGFPYWIWRVLPDVCPQYLPGKGYQSLGMIFEKNPDGRDRQLPIGTSQRRYQGIDRVFVNCAVCHTSTVRAAADQPPTIVLGMPAATFNMKGFEEFFFRCAADPKFSKEFILPEIERQGGQLDLLDRYVVYPLAIAIMRDRVLALAGRFDWVFKQHEWGPGRVDTFNSAKVIFNFPMAHLDPDEFDAPADFPSLWRQRQRKEPHEMQLHWDGNNTTVEERNKSAAFGTGTTPPTIDIERISRVEDWILDVSPPSFSQFFPVDAELALRGAPIYQAYCANCHGASGSDFSGELVGKVTPLAEIGTDRRRLDSYSYTLAVNQATLYAGYPWRFTHFRKTHGYANMPLDGIWLRAPYLHNGSVPSLRDLLEPAAARPATFYRGNDVYDPVKVGFVSDQAQRKGQPFFLLDTAVPGNGNGGHEGKAYGTELSADEKTALVEFMKTF
ncbi:cytochrome c [Accumulibacter sp.]|uniref:c-type cytochrome n=1 Tax=Accumulibacter sp. TaxID=2053492 RepID=UPI002BEB02FB|nr:cytochrome c [Accumulibacter sp.]HRF04352.1 cytochrome c [Accumulibacter sp.]